MNDSMNTTERMVAAIRASENISPNWIAREIADQVWNAFDGLDFDHMFTEARTLIQNAERIMDDANAAREILAAIDLRAIAADGEARRAQTENQSRTMHRASAVDRLNAIGLDEEFADIELKGCTEAEHWDWLISAPADELRAYRAEMLGGVE